MHFIQNSYYVVILDDKGFKHLTFDTFYKLRKEIPLVKPTEDINMIIFYGSPCITGVKIPVMGHLLA